MITKNVQSSLGVQTVITHSRVFSKYFFGLPHRLTFLLFQTLRYITYFERCCNSGQDDMYE